jgi:hypothetical protein
MRESLRIGLIGLISVFTACQKTADHAPVIAQAYAGPATLKLRSDIPLQSPTVATVKHGDKLDILQHRRRFLKVRTQRGVEGWTDDRMLLSAAEIAALQEVEKRARTLPSQGVASTYAMLNVHTQPNLLSPSFLQIAEGEKFDVVAHVVAERVAPKRQPLIPPRPKTKGLSHKQVTPRYAPPPMPTPPPPPPNWRDLSQTPPEVQQEIAEAKAANRAPTDDWTLIRTKEGESGWALTRRVFMAIPDEVAQYAEGHRITSYFPLDDVRDGDQVKHDWLWTTSSGNGYDFDSFRVFIWSLRRHRYETSFIQRNVEGYFPVLLRKVEMSSTAKARGDAATSYPGFSVCLEGDNGQRIRRNYAFIVNVVRFAGEQACEAPEKPIW